MTRDKQDGSDGSGDQANSGHAESGPDAPTVVSTERIPVEPGDAVTRIANVGPKSEPPVASSADEPDATAELEIDAVAPKHLGGPSTTVPRQGEMRAAAKLAIGTVLFGEYEIIEALGSGGMGEVYKAHHRRLDEPRAIKVMHADLSRKEGGVALFLREAKALLAVHNSAVVHCHDLLSDEEGRAYLVMEMIDGISLVDKMQQGPLSPSEVVALGVRLAGGLAAAHSRGVVHRDISPDNVVLPEGDVSRAKLIDFGIAKILDEGQGTIVAGFKGKLSYASPEQLGFFGGKVDERSDFYSLGLVLCAAALGHPMGMGTTLVEAVDARRNLQHVPDGVPIELRSSIESLLALNPEDRVTRVEQIFPADVRGESRATPTAGASAGSKLRFVAAGVGLLAAFGGYALLTGGGSGEEARLTASTPARSEAPAGLRENIATPEEEREASVLESKSKPEFEAEVKPQKPAVSKPKPISALDEVRIVGLLRGAEAALAEDRLQNPKGDNAYEKYREVLRLDPKNSQAKQGLLNVASRYLALGQGALADGRQDEAEKHVARAASIAPHHPKLEETRQELKAGD
jgi:serine/threonine-protein kinase